MSNDESDQQLSAELKQVEAMLRELSPALGQFDRDRLMYLAGRASIPNDAASLSRSARQRILWPLATAASLLIAALLGGLLLAGRFSGERAVHNAEHETSTSIVAFPTQVDSPSAGVNQHSYIELRNLVLAHGLDALPSERLLPNISSEKSSDWPVLPQQILSAPEKGGST